MEDVVIKAESNVHAGELLIHAVYRLNHAHPWIRIFQQKPRIKKNDGVGHRCVSQVFTADIQRGDNPLQKSSLGFLELFSCWAIRTRRSCSAKPKGSGLLFVAVQNKRQYGRVHRTL